MGLYPPIVASSMPAFDIDKGKVKIYFTLSGYNSNKIDDIKAVHVTCRRQSSNVNVIKNDGFEILQKIPQQDDIDIPFHRYYIELENDNIQNNSTLEETGFEVNVLYKVQLRFSSKLFNKSQGINFYNNNIEHFSQWSTVCIIKPIKAPQFYIDDFHIEGEVPKEQDINNFYYNLADFVGVFKRGDSSQTLKSWRLRLLSNTYSKEDKVNIDSYTLADSGQQISSAYNYTSDNNSVVLECSLPYQLQENISYKLLFEITTKNDYYKSILYTFIYNPQNTDSLSGKLKTFVNEEQGYIKISYSSEESYTGNLVLRRTDARSNFLKWEDLKNFEVHGTANFDYYDFTAESGMVYRYLVQKRDARGRRGTPVYTQAYTVAEWEHAFLVQSADGLDLSNIKQLKLKFDFQISSFVTNISESKTDTIGSKYPYIRRNGDMYYKSFPCTGTITGFMDNANLFTSEEQLFYNNVKYYTQFEGQNNKAEFFWQEFQGNNQTIVSQEKDDPHILYTKEYDYTYERRFREIVQDFLYNSKPKLYKSTQQGNIFIKLMDISLTPKQQLGRLIYTFSATAYEIDQPTISTLNSYGIINVGNYNPRVSFPRTTIGQISSFKSDEKPFGNIFKAGKDIIGAKSSQAASNSIAAHHNYNQPLNNEVVTDFSLSYLRLTIESEPYLIVFDGNKYISLDDTPLSTYTSDNDPFDPGQITHKLYQIESSYDFNNVYLGHLFEINGEQIIIAPPNNIYELKEDNLKLGSNTTIVPAKDTAMTIDYIINLRIEDDISKVPKFIRTENVNAQLMGTFSSINELITRIKYQYRYTFKNENEDTVKRYVNGIKSILVDTQPGTVIKLLTSADTTNVLHRFVVNQTGQLFFEPYSNENLNYITKLYIVGRNIPKYQLNNRGNNFTSLNEVFYPVDKDLCTIENIPYIYFKNKWYKAEEQDSQESYDIDCPVDALLFYYASVRRDFY